jgi:dihydroorotate dehydrogenase electron transfer subunit
LLYKVIGNATKILSSKRPQQIVNILGPLGNGFDIKKNKQAILVAGGYAVSPLYALAQTLVNKNNQVTVFIGAYSKQQILCEKEFINLGAQVHIATENGSQGYKGYVTELLKKHTSKFKKMSNVMIYAAGPFPMLSALVKVTKGLAFPTQLSLESYIACGIGVCRGCAIPTSKGYKLCCKDGPVFDAEIIEFS